MLQASFLIPETSGKGDEYVHQIYSYISQYNMQILGITADIQLWIGLPKADATHLTPHGLVEHGKIISEAFKKCEQ